MITKEMFINYINQIEDLIQKTDTAGNTLDDLFEYSGCFTEAISTLVDPYITMIIDILSQAVDDWEEWVSWYAFENSFGINCLMVQLNGKSMKVTSSEQLWDIIQQRKGCKSSE